jgi:hypothetical protein
VLFLLFEFWLCLGFINMFLRVLRGFIFEFRICKMFLVEEGLVGCDLFCDFHELGLYILNKGV